MFENLFGSEDGNDPQNADQPELNIRKLKIGLALGSGVARGWAHIGIIRELVKAGIVPDVIAGTSIGAVVGGAYAADALDPLEEWALSLSKVNFFKFLDFRLRRGGLFGGQKLFDQMNQHFGQHNIEDLKIPFAAIACELMTGHEIWLQNGNMNHAIRASFALPGVFEPVNDNGRWLVDGALVNPVPVSTCRALGADVVIAVNLSEDIYGSRRGSKSKSQLEDLENMAGTGRYGVYADILSSPAIAERSASNGLLRRFLKHDKNAPSLFANMVASLNVLQNRLSRSRLAGDPPDITINPHVGHVGLMEFHRAEELIQLGAEAFLNEKDYIIDSLNFIGYHINQNDTQPVNL